MMKDNVRAARELMERARAERFAVGAFNVDNQQTLVATTGALVESEPHYFGASSNVHTEDIDYAEIRKRFSTPAGAQAFVTASRLRDHPAEYAIVRLIGPVIRAVQDVVQGHNDLPGSAGKAHRS